MSHPRPPLAKRHGEGNPVVFQVDRLHAPRRQSFDAGEVTQKPVTPSGIVVVSADDPMRPLVVGGKHVHIRTFAESVRRLGVRCEVVAATQPFELTSPRVLLAAARAVARDPDLARHDRGSRRARLTVRFLEDQLVDRLRDADATEDASRHFIAEDVIALHALRRAGVLRDRVGAVIHGYFAREAEDYGLLPENDRAGREAFLAYERDAYSACSRLIAVDTRIREYLVREMGVPSERVATLLNAIDTARFDVTWEAKREARRALREVLGLDSEAIVALVARRLVRKNGVVHAVHAMARLREARPAAYAKVAMLVCGDGPEMRFIARDVERARLDRVRLRGRVDHREIHRLFHGADVVVVPSVTSHGVAEASSLAALEGMASRNLVIASDVGGLMEVVRDSVTGYVVPEGDADAIADRLWAFAGAPDAPEARAIVERGHDYAMREHDPVAHAHRLLQLLNGGTSAEGKDVEAGLGTTLAGA